MTREEILVGIACYKGQQEEIIAAIRSHGGKLTANDFDKNFGGHYTETLPSGEKVAHYNNPQFKIWPYDRKAFILGSLTQSDDWAKYLDLTQLMCSAGLLVCKHENGTFIYMEANL